MQVPLQSYSGASFGQLQEEHGTRPHPRGLKHCMVLDKEGFSCIVLRMRKHLNISFIARGTIIIIIIIPFPIPLVHLLRA